MTKDTSKPRAKKVAAKAAGPSVDDVKAYLRAHPDFLLDNPEMVEVMTPPPARSNGNVVDLQSFMIDRLRSEVGQLRESHDFLINNARANQSTVNQIHSAVLTLLNASSFEYLVQAVTTDLAVLLDVDVVTICVETGGAAIPKAYSAGVRSLPEGKVGELFDENRDAILASHSEGDKDIFGSATGLVQSYALARLKVSKQAPPGLIAIGSRKPDMFDQNQGTEMLGFLARALETTIRQWLNLPA